MDINEKNNEKNSDLIWKEVFSASEIAKRLYNYGLCVIPGKCDGSKKPRIKWANYSRALISPTYTDIKNWFAPANRSVIVLCGKASGNLEVLDFDDFSIYERFCEIADAKLNNITQELFTIRTPRPGFQIWYRCSEIEGNQPLARIQKSTQPSAIIETRGIGGYAMTVGSPPYAHKNNKIYRPYYSNLSDLKTIDVKLRQDLFEIARSFNQYFPTKKTIVTAKKLHSNVVTKTIQATDLLQKIDWADILEPAGWSVISESGDNHFWCRPGKYGGTSASTNENVFYVWTTSTNFEANKGYTKLQVYAKLYFNDDLAKAAKKIYHMFDENYLFALKEKMATRIIKKEF